MTWCELTMDDFESLVIDFRLLNYTFQDNDPKQWEI